MAMTRWLIDWENTPRRGVEAVVSSGGRPSCGRVVEGVRGEWGLRGYYILCSTVQRDIRACHLEERDRLSTVNDELNPSEPLTSVKVFQHEGSYRQVPWALPSSHPP